MTPKSQYKCFPSASDDVEASGLCVATPQTQDPSYRLAFADSDFLLRDEMRGVRLQLELMKPELIQQEHDIEATVVVFGGARIPEREESERKRALAEQEANREPLNPDAAQRIAIAKRVLAKAHYYDEARKLSRLISATCHKKTGCKLTVITGGGPGIMEAANRGAHDIGAKNIGLNIVLPFEQAPNEYITPELSFQFHYFSIRKMHFLMRALALVAFPGGFGTMDELFETLTLIQTKKIKPVPVILFGSDFWSKAVNFDFLVEEGVISPADKNIFRVVDTAEEAHAIIRDFFDSQG